MPGTADREWRRTGTDPNSPAAVAVRRTEMEAAFAVETRDRLTLLADLARGRKVLDVGCVDHEALAVREKPTWLHARLAETARECVGVDFEADAVEEMRRLGYDAIACDITQGIGPIEDRVPFELVVAGEIVEHLSDLGSLLGFGRDALEPGGRMVLTTPNPYAPWRVRAGQLRLVYESADHTAYLFPSGMAELAHRAGLRLVTATTVEYGNFRSTVVELVRALAGHARGRRRGLGRGGLPLPDQYVTPWAWIALARRARHGQLGEHSVYVLEKPRA